MKKFLRKIILIPVGIIVLGIIFLLLFNNIIMPWYVSAPEYQVPNVVGMKKEKAIKILSNMNLEPIEDTPRYDENFPKDHVMFQNPKAGTTVKEGRRVYLSISGGEPQIKMPALIGKTERDAKITLERLGLEVDTLERIRSEFPANTIVEQEYEEGTNLSKGTEVALKVSVGPQVGMIRVPNIVGKSLNTAEDILRKNSLRIGKISYYDSPTLLPNTIYIQYPSEDKLVSIGDSVDVVVTSSN
jgi:serine/threonine-protein kinase